MITRGEFHQLLQNWGEERAEKELLAFKPEVPIDEADWWVFCMDLWLHRKTVDRSERYDGSITHAALEAERRHRALGNISLADECQFQRFVLVRSAWAREHGYDLNQPYPYTYEEWMKRDQEKA